MIHHKAIDELPRIELPAGSEPVEPVVGVRSELERPRPSCSVCSADYAKRTGLPARCLVERALIVRDTSTGLYRAIVHCHGATELLELGDHTDAIAVSAAIAFKRGR